MHSVYYTVVNCTLHCCKLYDTLLYTVRYTVVRLTTLLYTVSYTVVHFLLHRCTLVCLLHRSTLFTTPLYTVYYTVVHCTLRHCRLYTTLLYAVHYTDEHCTPNFYTLYTTHSPLILLRLRTRIIIHAQTAAQQQSNGNFDARMSEKCGEWRDEFIMTLSPIHWVPVQDKGSKILCVNLGAMKVTPSDPLHQEYLTINLGSTSD